MFISSSEFEAITTYNSIANKMMLKSLLLVTVFGVVLAENVQLNQGNVAIEVVRRVARSPQQTNFPGFSNIAPPGFDVSQIVSQNTDVSKNGYAQSTIYKSENGMGSSSTSFSSSQPRSGAASMTLFSSFAMVSITVLATSFIRH
ncbi:uncharacterized protein LOC135699052 [Ochlerotatus camptorhynchus]|uniref:uncharacterized protein LOC135699052 n=1 Tax=Ochlerotatus camptorhynchus TaxID=644619 RepID=UPI0031D932A0